MTDEKPYKGSVSDRLERLPFSSVQRNFLFMVAGGEWVETLMLLGNGALLAMVAVVLHFSKVIATVAVPTAFFAGEFVGSIMFGRLADRFGRKTVFLYNLLIFAAGMIIAGFMSNYIAMAIFVFIGGIGVGGEFPVVDTFTTEMMPGKERGKRVATVYTIAVTSILVFMGLAYLLSIPKPGFYSFRILFWFMGAAALVVWAIRTRMKESPRWLEVQGRYAEADKIVTGWEDRVKKEKNISTLPPPTESIEIKHEKSRYKDIFAKDVRKMTIMMLIFQFFQSGIFYGFVSLAPSFLADKHVTFVHTILFSLIIYSGFIVGSIANLFIIDKIERKWGIILTAVLAGIFGIIFAIDTNIIAVVILGFLVAFLLWNFSNFYHVYQAEIFPTRIRPTAAGTVYSVSRVSTSILVLFMTALILPHGILASFGFIWLLIAIVIVDIGIFGPRTSKKRVEDIAQ